MSDTRPATPEEVRKFVQAQERLERLQKNLYITQLLIRNSEIASEFYAQWFPAGDWDMAQRLPAIKAQYARIKRNVDALSSSFSKVLNQEFGLQFRPSGDFDVVAPQVPNWSDLYAPYMVDVSNLESGLGVAPLIAILVFVGVAIVVVAGTLITLAALDYAMEKVKDQVLEVRSSDKFFCKDPNSDMCRAWMEKRKEEYAENESTIDKLMKEAGKGLGLILAIVALVAVGSFALSHLSKKGN